jgi:hypothetical protein
VATIISAVRDSRIIVVALSQTGVSTSRGTELEERLKTQGEG